MRPSNGWNKAGKVGHGSMNQVRRQARQHFYVQTDPPPKKKHDGAGDLGHRPMVTIDPNVPRWFYYPDHGDDMRTQLDNNPEHAMAILDPSETSLLKLLNDSILPALTAIHRPPMLVKGTTAEVEVHNVGPLKSRVVFRVIAQGTLVSQPVAEFQVLAPAQALLDLKNSKEAATAIVRAVGTVVRDQGLPRGLVEKWLASGAFHEAVMAWLDGQPSTEDDLMQDLAELL